MFWIFALGIVVTAVYHEGFRKILAWTFGCSISLIAIGAIVAKLMYP